MKEDIGNKLYGIVSSAKGALFEQGEIIQLTRQAFVLAAEGIEKSNLDEFQLNFPIGYSASKVVIPGTKKYTKEQLLRKYEELKIHLLAVNGMLRLVTIVEAMLSDVIREVIMKYPKKLGSKCTMPLEAVLGSQSIEEIYSRATDALLNELAYKSPEDFAIAMEKLLSIKVLECSHYHRYMEVKATRDIYIHNRGIANDIYVRKAASHVRAKAGLYLPVDLVYFLESYEACLLLTEWLEAHLHQSRHSSIYESTLNSRHEAVEKA